MWVCFGGSQTWGWDFGISGSDPIPLSDVSPNRPHLDFIGSTNQGTTGPSRVVDMVTRKEVFQLLGKYAEPNATKWDGRYLVAGYSSREVLILDFGAMIPQ